MLPGEITYAEFGERFIRRAVTEQRVAAALAGLGKDLRIGPIKGFMAEATVHGRFGTASVTTQPGEEVRFDVAIPVSLDVSVVGLGQRVGVGGDLLVHVELVARAAKPLKLYMDARPLTVEDIALRLRLEGPGSALLKGLGPMDAEIRRQIATIVNGRLAAPESVASRTVDVAAKIDGAEPAPVAGPPQLQTYGEFGGAFFRHAVTTGRISGSVASFDGRTIDIGPLKAGPKDMAEVTAHGDVGAPVVHQRPADLVSFDLDVPVDLDMGITLGHGKEHRFRGRVEIPLVLQAQARDPLVIFIDVPPVTPDQVRVDLHADGFVGGVLKKVGGIEKQVASQVASAVNDQVTGSVASRTIDVGARVDGA